MTPELDLANIIQKIAINALPLLFSVILHEVAHGWAANRLGDPTARMLGRLTLNPVPHIDPIGTVLMPLMLLALGGPIFGYARPVPITTANFRHPTQGMAIAAAAGPAVNILLAVASVILLRLFQLVIGMSPPDIVMAAVVPISLMLNASIIWNTYLAVFNMIPLLPLDGGRVLMGILPRKAANSFSRIEPYGFLILMILIFSGFTRHIVTVPVNLVFGFLEWIGGLI
ncbi:MAG: site-2 protease family protein [Nitrospirae bacterium]|nr:site-2 protease family protein [Nitrospirota bacterium]